MNGIRIRPINHIRLILHDYHQLNEKREPAYLTGVTILFGIAHPTDPEPGQIEFSENDHATARVVWLTIASSSLKNETATVRHIAKPSITMPTSSTCLNGGGNDPRFAHSEKEHALAEPPNTEDIAYVWSIIVSSLHFSTDLPCFHHGIRSPVHLSKILASCDERCTKEIGNEAMYKHLDSCYSVGTFGAPKIPPANVTVLPVIIVLKMIRNALK
jgi:hypothetical protein